MIRIYYRLGPRGADDTREAALSDGGSELVPGVPPPLAASCLGSRDVRRAEGPLPGGGLWAVVLSDLRGEIDGAPVSLGFCVTSDDAVEFARAVGFLGKGKGDDELFRAVSAPLIPNAGSDFAISTPLLAELMSDITAEPPAARTAAEFSVTAHAYSDAAIADQFAERLPRSLGMAGRVTARASDPAGGIYTIEKAGRMGAPRAAAALIALIFAAAAAFCIAAGRAGDAPGRAAREIHPADDRMMNDTATVTAVEARSTRGPSDTGANP